MSPSLVMLSLAFVGVVAAASPEPDGSAAAEFLGQAAEVQRIQTHFDSVLRELDEVDLAVLSVAQRERRHKLMQTLAVYRHRAVFPNNYDFAAPTPYFVDRKTGTLCAVAHLMESTGRRDIVDRVAAANNNVWVMDLSADPAVAEWLSEQGISLREAARIQVPYIGQLEPGASVAPREKAYAVGTATTVGLAAVTSVWNAWGNRDGHNMWGTAAGIATGALGLAYSYGASRDDIAPRSAAPLTLVAGAASAYFTARGFMRHRSTRAAAAAQSNGLAARTTIAPLIPVRGVSGAGVAMRIAF